MILWPSCSEILMKYSIKYPRIDSVDGIFPETYSKTSVVDSKTEPLITFDPFDLSNPEPKDTDFHNFMFSARLVEVSDHFYSWLMVYNRKNNSVE